MRSFPAVPHAPAHPHTKHLALRVQGPQVRGRRTPLRAQLASPHLRGRRSRGRRAILFDQTKPINEASPTAMRQEDDCGLDTLGVLPPSCSLGRARSCLMTLLDVPWHEVCTDALQESLNRPITPRSCHLGDLHEHPLLTLTEMRMAGVGIGLASSVDVAGVPHRAANDAQTDLPSPGPSVTPQSWLTRSTIETPRPAVSRRSEAR